MPDINSSAPSVPDVSPNFAKDCATALPPVDLIMSLVPNFNSFSTSISPLPIVDLIAPPTPNKDSVKYSSAATEIPAALASESLAPSSLALLYS